jgi:hypothetical protein
MANNQIDIKYLNKDFNSFKADLIEYARSYYPTTYNDFTQASPGSMFIEMAAYVGDVLSFYLDNQLQETFLQYAKQKNNLYTMAYMLGYRPKVTSAAVVNLEVYQQLPTKISGLNVNPDFNYAMTIEQGMQIKSNVDSSILFYVPQKVDFTQSSSYDPTTVEVYTVDGTNTPTSYLLKKTVQAISGEVKTQTFSFGAAQRFITVNISDNNIISVLNAVDSDGNTWYEVPYLAQDYILTPVANTAANYPNLYQYQNQVPFMMQKISVPRRFVSRFRTDGTLEIEFGSGVNYAASAPISDLNFLPNPNSVSVGFTGGGLSTLSSSFDPTNFVTTQTYGLAPKNTSITFQYLVGGGASSNALSNQLTEIASCTATDTAGGNNPSKRNTLLVTNPDPASGGGDGDTVDQLRLNIANEFPTQLRVVTQEDYMSRTMSMPAQYGKVSKAFVTKDDATFHANMQTNGNLNQNDQVLVSLYVLGLNSANQLADPSPALLANIQTYLKEYRMLTDAINIKPAYVINIGCNFEIIIRPNYTSQDVIARCILVLQNLFNTDNWQINQPIILGDIYSTLDQVEGVQTVKTVQITNKTGESDGYSRYSYDISAGTLNGVIYPSLDPSIFELKYPNTDIQGRVITL